MGYAAAVSFVDEQVGRVLGALRRHGGENATLTLLLSDHGFKLGHHGNHWGKHTLMSADTHVPLLLRAPGFGPKRVHAPVELIDLFPTLCELAGLHEPGAPCVEARRSRQRASRQPPLEGRSLVPLMRRRSPKAAVARAAAISQWPLRKPLQCMGYAVRTQGWLLIQWAADQRPREKGRAAGASDCEAHTDLFRVDRNASRSGELRDELLPSGSHPHVTRRLRRRLWAALRRR